MKVFYWYMFFKKSHSCYWYFDWELLDFLKLCVYIASLLLTMVQ